MTVDDFYEEDELRVIAAYKKHGYEISREQAEEIWMEYSAEECFAVWMMMPEDLDVIFEITFKYAEPIVKSLN